MSTDPTDAELIVRVLAGDIDAYAPLVDRHHDSCARYARRMLGDGDDAEDVLQETFLRAYVGLNRYHERDRFRAWLFRILINECRSHVRRRVRRSRRIVLDPTADAAVGPTDGAADGLRGVLQTALDRLDPPAREALLLKYGEQLDYEQMSHLTGSSVSALKMRVKRARDAMRPMLEELLHE